MAALGTLFVVSTPIGHLADMTYRGVETLRRSTLLLSEDTRHSGVLLRHYGIATRPTPFHEHNEAKSIARVLSVLRSGADVALISDAGTPLLSDPGARLVSAVVDAGFAVSPVPGASALLAALVGTGIDFGAGFTFLGFLARKGKERSAQLLQINASVLPVVLYEAPTRVAATLADLVEMGCGDRRAVVARELTKQFEEYRRGTTVELAAYYKEQAPRGEIVIVVDGAAAVSVAAPEELKRVAERMREEGVASREIVRRLAAEHGASRNVAYRIVHDTPEE